MVQLLAAQNCEYELLDISGRVLDRGLLRYGITNVSAADLPNALYLLRVTDGKGHAWTRSWVRY
jgi:hypothetical protein